jgi:spermidine/putrescine transport system substrate-binding protein
MDDNKRYSRLIDRYRSGDLDRRTFLGLIGCAGLAAGVVGPWARFIGPAAAQVTQIRYDSWGGVVSEAMRKTAMPMFTQRTGIKVVEGTFGTEEEMFAKARAGRPGDYHIVNSAGLPWYKRWVDAGYGVVLNEANIPNLKNAMPALLEPFRKVTPAGLSAVPFAFGTTGIAYNKKYISDDEAKALRENLLLKKELAGKISGYNDWAARMYIAAVQSGQNPNDIKNVDAVWDKIREMRKLAKKFWNSGAEAMELLASEEVYAADLWSGRIAALQERGAPIGYVDVKGGYAWASDLLVLKGAPLEPCEQFLNMTMEPEAAIAIAEAQLYPPALDASKVQMTEKIKKLPNYVPSGDVSGYAFPDPDFWTKNEKDWKPIYQRIEKGF